MAETEILARAALSPDTDNSPVESTEASPPPYEAGDYVEGDEVGTSASSVQDLTLWSITYFLPSPAQSLQTRKRKYFVKFFRKLDFNKSYALKIQCLVHDEKLLRFKFKPRNGFNTLHQMISEKVHFNLDEVCADESLALGYVYSSDLVGIQSDEELLECIRVCVGKKKRKEEEKEIELYVYDSRKHLELRNQLRSKPKPEVVRVEVQPKRKTPSENLEEFLLGYCVMLAILFVFGACLFTYWWYLFLRFMGLFG